VVINKHKYTRTYIYGPGSSVSNPPPPKKKVNICKK